MNDIKVRPSFEAVYSNSFRAILLACGFSLVLFAMGLMSFSFSIQQSVLFAIWMLGGMTLLFTMTVPLSYSFGYLLEIRGGLFLWRLFSYPRRVLLSDLARLSLTTGPKWMIGYSGKMVGIHTRDGNLLFKIQSHLFGAEALARFVTHLRVAAPHVVIAPELLEHLGMVNGSAT